MSAPHVSFREFAKLANCDEKQVRRAVTAGKLTPDGDNKLDPALVDSGWRRTIRSSKAVADTPQVSAKSVRTERVVSEDDTPTEAAAKIVIAMGAEHDLKEALRIKENFNALLKQLEYGQKAGSLIELAIARTVLFDAARAARDSWMNWPMRVGPKIAADLGLEADRVTQVLIEHVHSQIADLGEPDAHFEDRQG
ncbi:hypothetical protein [Trinickia dinghuensis]|uniref:Elements of external origin n=1 Tax=Trinickia dinghuensis TaxID=2291023 RepID=A0A3D8K3P5_9BURK|nr:hypothetical protein [Trinickia dinghuensis]RDU99221.1 hypothetical protein DWV00_08840 [Trinickia dinghuensis]